MGMRTPPNNLTDASLHPATGYDVWSSRPRAASAATETVHHVLHMCFTPHVHYYHTLRSMPCVHSYHTASPCRDHVQDWFISN